MWVNAALSFALLPFAYLIYLTVRNIRWARRNSEPWAKYLAPMITLLAVTAAMTLWYITQFVFVLAAMHGGGTPLTGQSGPGVQTGNSSGVPAAAGSASPTLEAIMKERTDLRATLCRSVPGVALGGSKTSTVDAAFNAWYETMRQAGLRNDPRVLACAIAYLDPNEIPDAREHYKNMFPEFRPLDPAHQVTSININTVASAKPVTTGGAYAADANGGEVGMTFAFGPPKTMLLSLILVDGVWLAQNFLI